MSLQETQLELESEMAHYGEKRFYDKIREATENSRESNNPASISLMKGALESVSKGIDEELLHLRDGKARIRKRIFAKLAETDSRVVAYLTLRALLDSISRGEALTTMAIKIGRFIEDELQLTEYMAQNRPLMDKVKRNVKKRTSNYKHQRNVLVHTARKAGLTYANWTTDYQLSIGIRLVDIVISTTGMFDIRSFKHKGRGRPAKHVVPTKKTLSWIMEKNNQLSILKPLKLPMVVTPKAWVSHREGGYLSLKFDFVRFSNHAIKTDYLGMIKDEKIKFSQIYDVVNAVQNTRWKINTRVLEVVDHFWNTIDEDVLECLPKKNEVIGSPHPGDDASKEVKKEWKVIASKIYGENIRNMSHKMAFTKMLWVANKFKDYEEMYFPHNLDFRGRVYPIPDFLTPQGDDVCRGLLQFAEGKTIATKKGQDYFLRYGASLYGLDKASDKAKDAWVDSNHDSLLLIASNPLEHSGVWNKADKPWQFLAWCFEYKNWFYNTEGYKVSLPIMVDGTCNGLQHLSAIMKDKEGGKAVNLIGEGDTPNDIYQMVADRACSILPNSSISMDRKLCKRPVMTTPYGATIYGMREQIKDELKKRKTKIGVEMEWDNWDNIVEVSEAIYEAIGQIIVKSREFMDWLQDIAETVGKSNFPMEWMTPFGFYVYQTYYKSKQRRITTHLSGRLKNYRASIREMIPYYQDIYKCRNSISPNFIHSMDASHLMFVVNDLAYEHGVKSLYLVHDCFGVHADSVDLLVRVLKDSFIEMYTGDQVVNAFIEDFLKKYLDRVDYFKIVEKRPQTGSLDINEVKKSRFFFS